MSRHFVVRKLDEFSLLYLHPDASVCGAVKTFNFGLVFGTALIGSIVQVRTADANYSKLRFVEV